MLGFLSEYVSLPKRVRTAENVLNIHEGSWCPADPVEEPQAVREFMSSIQTSENAS